jgi:predicted DNA-binding transcriptional regulator YafY
MLRIHGELRRGQQVNATGLGTELEVSRKTIVRDIGFMRDRLDLPIEFDARANTYRYTEPVENFPTVQVTEGEVMALLVARRALEQYQGTPFHQQLAVAFDKLTAGLKDHIAFAAGDEWRAVSFKNVGLGRTDLTVFTALSGAVLREREVRFAYRKPGESASAPRRVEPYHLSHRENLWYLVGRDGDRGELRTFALPRIREVRETGQVFTRPPDFSPERFFAGSLGVVEGREDHRVRVAFAAEVADRVRERVWHESQELHERRDGRLEVRLRLGALGEAERWVLGWGAAAEVLAPAELRRRVAATAAAVAQKNAGRV